MKKIIFFIILYSMALCICKIQANQSQEPPQIMLFMHSWRTVSSLSSKYVRNSNLMPKSKQHGLLQKFKKLSLGPTCRDIAYDSVSDIGDHILKESTKKIVAVVGAGISTASGIPDFRTPGTGLYDNLQKYDIPYPEAIFDLRYLYKNPKPFYALVKELYPGEKYKPNIVHHFLRLLHDKGKLLKVFTQNIDGLERVAGVPPNKLIEAHGTLSFATCLKCKKVYKDSDIKDAIFNDTIPKCVKPRCKGMIKPNIVFFGENLQPDFWSYELLMPMADLILVMGTSLEVMPFASIVDFYSIGTPRMLINNEIVGSFKHGNDVDVLQIGDISAGIEKLTESLGWSKELELLQKNSMQDE